MNSFIIKNHKIIDKKEVAPQIFVFNLENKINFKPGQFIETSLPHIGEATFVPCSDPRLEDGFELCIKACGSTTDAIGKLLPGDTMQIRGPYGNGWPIEKLKGKNIVLVAGGLGLVPLRPLIIEILKNRRSFGNISLYGGFRTDLHVLFQEDLKKWSKYIDINIYTEQISSNKNYHHGLITEPLKTTNFNSKNTVFLICGPETMLPFVLEAVSEHKIPEDQIYISFERRMECGIGVCQHCNIGKYLVCQDGPVFAYDKIKDELTK